MRQRSAQFFLPQLPPPSLSLSTSLGCDAGSYADVPKLSQCKTCPTGFIVADKRSKKWADCVPCSSDSDVPNDDQSACVNPDSLKGISGISNSESKTEGGTITYIVKMNGEYPSTTASVTVTLSIASNDPRCSVSSGDNIVFSAANWDKPDQTIEIVTKDDGLFLAKDSISYTCLITHTLTSSNTKLYTPVLSSRVLKLKVTSTGCGKSEFIGSAPKIRGSDSRKCICKEDFFLPPLSDCVQCPKEKSICAKIGMEAPKTAKGWWRADVQSSNLTEFPFYECLPGRCRGNANGSNTSCNTGYDENGPKCSTCATNYYMANGECIYCKSRSQTSAASSSLVLIIVVCILLYLMGGW